MLRRLSWNRRSIWPLVVAAGLLAAACQSAPEATPTAAPAAAPQPTSAPAAAATSAPAAPATTAPAAAAPASANAGGKPELTTLRVGNVRLAALSAVYVADKLGYFHDEGLTIQFKDLGGGAESIPAIEGGSLDISHVPYVSLLQARDQGFDYVALVTNNATPMTPPHEAAIMIRSEDASSIKSLKDLEGKTIATNTIKGLHYVMAVGAIRKEGGDDKKVKFVEVPDVNMVDGLTNHLFDAATTAEPYTSILQSSGKGKVLAYHYVEVAPGLDIGAYVSSRAFATKNPNTVNAFARALKKAHVYLSADQARARQLLGEVSNTPPETMQNIVFPVWTQSANEPSLTTLVGLMNDLGFIKSKPDVKEFVWEPSAL